MDLRETAIGILVIQQELLMGLQLPQLPCGCCQILYGFLRVI